MFHHFWNEGGPSIQCTWEFRIYSVNHTWGCSRHFPPVYSVQGYGEVQPWCLGRGTDGGTHRNRRGFLCVFGRNGRGNGVQASFCIWSHWPQPRWCSFCPHLLGRSLGGGLKNHHLLSSIFFLSSLALCPRGFQLVTISAPLGILGYIELWALLDGPLQVLTPSCSNSHFIQVKTGKVWEKLTLS